MSKKIYSSDDMKLPKLPSLDKYNVVGKPTKTEKLIPELPAPLPNIDPPNIDPPNIKLPKIEP